MTTIDYTPEALADIQDGCSGGVSLFYTKVLRRDVPFLFCCDEHDVAYHEGGTSKDRALADERFRVCISESGRPFRAWVFWIFVRCFGWLFWGKNNINR